MKTKVLTLMLVGFVTLQAQPFMQIPQEFVTERPQDNVVSKSTQLQAELIDMPSGAFSYQALVTDTLGKAVSDKDISLMFSVLSASVDGVSVYSESQTLKTNKQGLLSANVGEGESSDSFSDIKWGMMKHFLKVEVKYGEMMDYAMLSVSEILSVPYALQSKHAHYADALTSPIRYAEIDSTLSRVNNAGFYQAITMDSLRYGILSDIYGVGGTAISVRGNIFPEEGDNALKMGVLGSVIGSGEGDAEGVRGQAFSNGQTNTGLLGLAGGPGNGNTGYSEGSYNDGVIGYGYNNSWGNVGVYGVSSGSVGVDNLGLVGLSVVDDGSDTIQNVGSRSMGKGPGINYGAVGFTENGRENYGLVGEAMGGSELNIAVKGIVEEGVNNFAGVFDGKVEVNGKLNLTDVLNLAPMAGPPATPSDGDLYLDSNDGKVKIYIAGMWKALAFE